jgi:hypothetical protein|tara:strand:+ start:1913 stop:2335 length:423 start_codon:yes stop_codon:yes gene_type:complete
MFDISKYFRKGANNSIEFKNGANLSYSGPSSTLVESGTEIDRWYVGEFMGAEYTIACDVSTTRKEVIKALCTASPEKANIMVYGRSNLGHDLLRLEVVVTDSYFSLVAYPREQDDSTVIAGAKVIYSANYYKTQNEATAT